MATKEFWNDIINEVKSMSDEEFLSFVDECEETPEISLTVFESNVYELPPADIEAKITAFRVNDFVITQNSVYEDLPDWACVA